MFLALWRSLPDYLALLGILVVQATAAVWIWRRCGRYPRPAVRFLVRLAAVLVAVWVMWGVVYTLPHFSRRAWQPGWVSWLRGTALVWGLCASAAAAIVLLWRRVPHNPARRGLLLASGRALAAAPFAVMGFAVLRRDDFELREVRVHVPGLPKDLDGLRLVQLSDIHLSPFLSEEQLARAVDMANQTRAHIALVTGDLVTGPGDPLEACLRQLARLRADAGIFGCLGNHEIYARVEDIATREGARRGIRFLRYQAQNLRFGKASLNLAGIDYERMGSRYLAKDPGMSVPGAYNVLLSHNPDVFRAAPGRGYDLTVAGHTHGGQVTVEILSQSINVARFYTPYVYGLYQEREAAAYVSRGIGTVGLPARLGAPPEVALIRLCAT